MMIRGMIFILVLFFITGCGMSGSTTTDSTRDTSIADDVANLDLNATDSGTQIATANEPLPSDDTALTEEQSAVVEPISNERILPQTISMDFPKVLKTSPTIDDNNQSSDENSSSKKSEDRLGYEQLKKDISEIEDVIKITKLNLVILEEVMPEILERCEGMIACTFEDKALSFVMNSSIISSIESIVDNNRSFSELNGSKIVLGEIGFKKYDDLVTYKYGLTFNIDSEISFKDSDKILKTIPLFKSDDNGTIREFQTLKWSDDNRDVITTYVYEDNQTSSNISIHYLTGDDGKEIMHIYDNHDNQSEGIKENMNLTLANKDDSNSTFTLRTNSIEEFREGNETNVSSFSSNAEISEESSLLLFSGKILDEESGNEASSTSEILCENNESCDANITEGAVEIELYELKITGGELEDGSYILLAPYTDIKELDLIDIFEMSLGTFTIFEGKAQGELHNNSYKNMLNELMIIKIIESQESTDMFKIVDYEDKPTLEIVKY